MALLLYEVKLGSVFKIVEVTLNWKLLFQAFRFGSFFTIYFPIHISVLCEFVVTHIHLLE